MNGPPASQPSVTVCPACRREGGREAIRCEACGDLVEVVHRATTAAPGDLRAQFVARRASLDPRDRSGVWRYRELIHPTIDPAHIVSQPEGNTPLYQATRRLAEWVGVGGGAKGFLRLKHEGMNPTGSFKDRGMTVGASEARAVGARAVACASTRNT